MRWLPCIVAIVVGCGGKIAPTGDAGSDVQALCKAIDSTCSAHSECCSGICDPQSHACATSVECSADLSACAVDSDCCSGICSTGDGLCGCVNTHETGCGVDSDCCSTSDTCVNGVCQ